MANQNYILLAIGLFVALIATVVGVDRFLLDEHPPSEVSGLIWRVENALSHIQDLEAVLELTEHEGDADPMRLLVRLVMGPPVALSVRYLAPADVKDEVFTVQNDLLSHYIPSADLIVIKRWVQLPLAALGLAGLDLTELEDEWSHGDVTIDILKNASGFPLDFFAGPLTSSESIAGLETPVPCSFCLDSSDYHDPSAEGFSRMDVTLGEAFQSGYILEVRDAKTLLLTRMVWVDRDSYLIQKVVYFTDGQRDRTLRVQRITLDQGLTPEEVLSLPRGPEIETVRG
jgi:hypothetical protein